MKEEGGGGGSAWCVAYDLLAELGEGALEGVHVAHFDGYVEEVDDLPAHLAAYL